MNHEIIQKLIPWIPTMLFALSLLFYFLMGLIRGFRKSVIFFIHATISFAICLIIFFSIVNSEDVDKTMFSLVNAVMKPFGMSITDVVGGSSEVESLRELLLYFVKSNMGEEELIYYLLVDTSGYISALVEMLYRISLSIVLSILYILIIFILTIIYHIFYPVRRKARRFKKYYENGDVSEPYRKRRLMGGFVGMFRGIIVNIFLLSLIGGLLWVVTGENRPLPNRKEGTTEEIALDENVALIYDYVEAGFKIPNTGIFWVLNGIKDPDGVPFYLYINDQIYQGAINDPNLGIEEVFYLRREFGAYTGFIKDIASLCVEYAGPRLKEMLSADAVQLFSDLLQNEDFVQDLYALIDEFKTQPYFMNFILAALNSAVNHMDLLLGSDNMVTKLVQTVFNQETGIKFTDLGTVDDCKYMFKSLINLAATALKDIDINTLLKNKKMSEQEQAAFDIRLAFKYASIVINDIQHLSIFNERKEIGNKFFGGIYNFCVNELVKDTVDLPQINQNTWIDEFNILFDSIEYLLTITSEIYDNDMNVMVDNLLHMFEGEKGVTLEQTWDNLVGQISKSKLLDVVFRSTVPGKTIDALIQNMTGNPEASMPKKFSISSTETTKGELQIILECVKVMIKNDYSRAYELIAGGNMGEEGIRELFEIINKDINPSEDVDENIIDLILESRILRYAASSFITYSDFGDIKIHITKSASEQITEVIEEEGQSVSRTHNVITKNELSILFDFVLNSPDFIISLFAGGDIDVLGLVTSDEITNLLKESKLLQGIIAGVFTSLTENIDMIVLPYGYDDPERWIQDKEVESLIDAIVALKETKTESGEPLINELMNGNVDLNTILNLEQDTISAMYKSKVLKYTISGALTNLSGEGFGIVVPGVSCEEDGVGVITSKGNKINIVSENEILNIFDQIGEIVDINGSEVKVLYSKIFNEKSKVLKSYTIQATIINLLVDMSSDEESFIKLPKSYIKEYDLFVEEKDEANLVNNKWFASKHVTPNPEDPVSDDELYVLFEAIEELLGDDQKTTDENGNIIIKDTFSLDSIGDSIEIKKNSVDTITSSVVLNATLTDAISTNLATPVSVLEEENSVIKKDELKSLLDSLFSVLDKGDEESITLDDVGEIDLESLKISRKAIDEVYINSQIFMTALSDAVTTVENVVVPVSAIVEIEAIFEHELKTVYRIIDETLIEGSIENNEFDNIIACLFEFFGEPVLDENYQEIDQTLNLEKFEDVEDLKLNNDNIEIIVQSVIFAATMSNILSTEEELVIPLKGKNEHGEEIDVAVQTEVVDQEELVYVLTGPELESTLKSLLEIFGEENSEGEKELGVVIDLTDFIVDELVKQKILKSEVLSATISKYIMNEGKIIVPEDEYIIGVEIVNGSNIVDSFTIDNAPGKELEKFIDASIVLFGKDGKLNINHINLNDFNINNDNVEYLDDSHIINATTTNELVKVNDLVIPEKDSNGEAVTISYNVVSKNKLCATMIDIVPFMKEILEIFGGSINPSNLSSFKLTLVKGEDLDGVLWATFSKQLIKNNDILIPYENQDNISKINVLSFDEQSGIYGSEMDLVTVIETNHFKDSLINVLSNTNTLELNLEKGIKVEEMVFSKEDVNDEEGIFESNIFAATVAKTILGLSSLKVPSIVKISTLFYGNAALMDTLNKDQVISLFNSLFVATNDADIQISDFKTSKMTLPTDKASVKNMLESLIVAATMSEEIVVKSNGSTVILEDFMDNYKYDKDGDGMLDSDNERYISIEELTNLIYALTEGFGKTLIADLKFDDLNVPSNDKIAALIGSELIKATISREIMKRQGGISIEANICSEEKLYNENKYVAVIKGDEIRLLIEGFNALAGNNSNASFKNISIGVNDLLGKADKVNAVAYSSILRSIISTTLKGTPSLVLVLGQPQETDVYKTFEIISVETDTLFKKDQILILESLGSN